MDGLLFGLPSCKQPTEEFCQAGDGKRPGSPVHLRYLSISLLGFKRVIILLLFKDALHLACIVLAALQLQTALLASTYKCALHDVMT